MKNLTKKTILIVSAGQYETCATRVVVRHKTWRGLCRRITQIRHEYAVYGDNFAGWLPAKVALASDQDEWGDNIIIGGQWCDPANGWIVDDEEMSTGAPYMTYQELYDILYG